MPKHHSQTFRDKDKDLKLNAEEVKDWIIPPDYDHTDAETKHLITEADADKVKYYREYRANRDKRKRHIFSSENDRFDLKTDSDRSVKPILYF